MKILENKIIQLRVNQEQSTFDILINQPGQPSLIGNRLALMVEYEDGRQGDFFLSLANTFEAEPKLESKKLIAQGDEPGGINYQIEFSLSPGSDMLLWRVELRNSGFLPVFINKISLLEPYNPAQANLVFRGSGNNASLAFHSNGWQSWSYTGTYQQSDKMRRSRLGFLQEPMVINPGTPQYSQAGMFSGDFFGVVAELTTRSGLLLGFLSQKNHYGSITADLRGQPSMRLWANGDHARLDQGQIMATDWAVVNPVNLDDPHPLSSFLDAVAEAHEISSFPSPAVGWCSWYQYYQNISEETIASNLAKITDFRGQIPLDLLQIDDGFEAQVGDWLEFQHKFPRGVVPLASEIKAAGLTPGLWLAPFILHPGSRLANDHPQWLLRHKNGRLARAGFVWNSLGAALDLTVPDALEYACKVLDLVVHQWGYPYLKLDFLYAAALKGVYHDPTRTRAQVLRSGMEALRRTAGEDVILLGCGAPLGSMLGLVQAMRIGADVSGHWRPKYFGTGFPFRKEPHMPSVRNSIQNILTRAPLNNKWWVNDPDCLLVRPDSSLTLREVQSLATAIGMTGGSVLLSDDLTALSTERLEIAGALLPPMQKTAQVLDWMDAATPQKLRLDLQNATGKWHLLAYFNWADVPKLIHLHANEFHLPNQDYWVRSFWERQVSMARSSQALFTGVLPAHGSLLAAVRPATDRHAIYLGSNIHISQGLEVNKWQVTKTGVSLGLSPGRQVEGIVDVFLPKEPDQIKLDELPLSFKSIGEDIYRLSMMINKTGYLEFVY